MQSSLILLNFLRMIIIDDNHFIELAISCCSQVFFDVKMRQFLRVDTRGVYPAADAAAAAGGGSACHGKELTRQGQHSDSRIEL